MAAHNGLPMGLQIVTDLGCDSELVTLAVHIESTLND
jgi:Asp-tRNA(Asn)/Glu-tRNA(Gln) amidotransferase A subunit family amidase